MSEPRDEGIINPIGLGKIVKQGKKRIYNGSFPTNTRLGDEMVLMSADAYDSLIEQGQALLSQTKQPMAKEFYEIKEGGTILPDEMHYNDGEDLHKLILDRHFYSLEMTKYLWVRWESVDFAIEEEEW